MSRIVHLARVVAIVLLVVSADRENPVAFAQEHDGAMADVQVPSLPDNDLVTAYRHAATHNVLAAVNPQVFPGYFSVCADGLGFGEGNTYPSLDGHQMTEALLWLGKADVVKLNWDYVRSFQLPNGSLPLAILPSLAGQRIGPEDTQATVEANGGLYRHWVPGNPLASLASPTFIQNADVIYRHTLDRRWLEKQIDAVNLAADYLNTLTTREGLVRGAGYYVERPTRIASDGVAQCHAADAFRRVAALNRVLDNEAAAKRYEQIADRITSHFTKEFWKDARFAEYLHPERGLITSHGLTDVDWAALATDVALPQQRATLWRQLRRNTDFYYGGMPTGISTRPQTYEDWEFSHPDRHDLAAMGRVWFVESWARSRFHDAEGLLDGLHRVAAEGRDHGYFWRERYYPSDTDSTNPAGAEKYCEYPANLIRIVNRFLLGIDLRLDGSILLAPNVTPTFWDRGFGHTLRVRRTVLEYRLHRDGIDVTYSGPVEQRLGVRFPANGDSRIWKVKTETPCKVSEQRGILWLSLPPTSASSPRRFRVDREAG